MTHQSNNVVRFPRRLRSIVTIAGKGAGTDAFDNLTVAIIMDRHRRGELEPAILAALLQGCGLEVRE